ncbi:YggS family pyridoxal phosphate-dependent enzyme [Lentibacillus saliphilus]|uniref:YggS family pyridoxal phosphate-dependent enzyme n=1 Tax=Lentibacillus saliphilus TaxID=2737028 RepID=UPI002484967E|nr:YggS family pyridoxal phosphate-dependent enzyme [Lentibacillus saliphilus]
MTSVVHNLEAIHNKMRHACERSGRQLNDITIIGVTKYATIERTEEAINAGISHIGENRLEGFLKKYEAIQSQVGWHFIGTLQSRKVRDIVNKVTAIHSLDRLSLAQEINKRAEEPVECFVQVNVSGEASKHGLAVGETEEFIQKLSAFEHIKVIGLMTMAPYTDHTDDIRRQFRALADLKRTIEAKQWSHAPCHNLSMGMSNDYDIAIEEGATHIRLGTCLLGPS